MIFFPIVMETVEGREGFLVGCLLLGCLFFSAALVFTSIIYYRSHDSWNVAWLDIVLDD